MRSPITDETEATMTEARYNDLCYMILKKLFFEQGGASPRECDIRVCMQMGCPQMINKAGPLAAILLPNEKAPNSHSTLYTINYKNVFNECLDYLEDHWMKQTIDEAYEKEGTRNEMWQWIIAPGSLIDAINSIPEEQCGTYVP